MLCVICLKRLPRMQTSVETATPSLSRWRAHTKCLHESVVFDSAPSRVLQLADLAENLRIDSVYLATEWLSMSSRLKTLGMFNLPNSKWKWERITDSSGGQSPPKMPGLLNKRGSEDLVGSRERGFNLDLFDLVRTTFGLTHPSLGQVRKAIASHAKSPPFELVQSEVNHRIKGIRQWLEKVTKNYDQDSLGDQMMKCILRLNKGQMFRKPDPDREQVLVAGQSKMSLSESRGG